MRLYEAPRPLLGESGGVIALGAAVWRFSDKCSRWQSSSLSQIVFSVSVMSPVAAVRAVEAAAQASARYETAF
jgi:hypothetical protein